MHIVSIADITFTPRFQQPIDAGLRPGCPVLPPTLLAPVHLNVRAAATVPIKATLAGESFPAEFALEHVVTPSRTPAGTSPRGTTQTDPICLKVLAEFTLARLLLLLLRLWLGLACRRHLFYIIAGGRGHRYRSRRRCRGLLKNKLGEEKKT